MAPTVPTTIKVSTDRMLHVVCTSPLGDGPPVKARGVWPHKQAARWRSCEARRQKSLLWWPSVGLSQEAGHPRGPVVVAYPCAAELPALLHGLHVWACCALGAETAPGRGGGTCLHLLMSHTWVEQPLGTGPWLGSKAPRPGRPGKEQACEICAPGDLEEESQPSQRESSRRERTS